MCTQMNQRRQPDDLKSLGGDETHRDNSSGKLFSTSSVQLDRSIDFVGA